MLTCSPERLDSLAAGHLICESWVDDTRQIRSLRQVRGPGGAFGIAALIDEDRAAAALALQQHRLEHGCGLRHILDCDNQDTPAADAAAPTELPSAFRALFAAADAAAQGGVHAAAFMAAGALKHVAIDVARHCAVDRAIGLAWRDGRPDEDGGLVLSSRISGAIALKAVHARVRWVASRSIATPLAREIARAGGVTLLEQAARRP